MDWSRNKCFVVIPAFKDAGRLAITLEKTVAAFTQFQLTGTVLVLHNGERDTLPLLGRNLRPPFPLRWMKKQEGQSKGEALQQALGRLSLEAKLDDTMIIMPTAQQYNPMLMFRMHLQIMEGSDIVIASRFSVGARNLDITPHSKSYKWFTNTLYRLKNPGLGWIDYTSNFGAYRTELLRTALAYYGKNLIEKENAVFAPELLGKLKRFHPIIHQLPSVSRGEKSLEISENEIPLSAPFKESEWNRVA